MQLRNSSIESFLKDIVGPDGAINLADLKKIAGGGTHDVYQSERHPGLLLKVMKRKTGKSVAELSEHIKKLDQEYSILYKTFEPSRCILEKRSMQLIKTNSSDEPTNTIVSVVPFESCFASKEKFGFNVKPLELDGGLIESKRYLYQRASTELMGVDAKSSAYVMRSYPTLNPEFERIFKLLDTDKGLAATMKEFLTKYGVFYRKSGILLDTIGLDNVLFYKDNEGSWQFKLGSVIKHDTGALTKKMLAEVNKNPAIANSSFASFTSIYFMPACIRALNACAAKLGMSRVVDDVTLDEKTIDTLAEVHLQLGEMRRINNYTEHGEFSKALALYRQYNAKDGNASKDKLDNTELRDNLGTRYWGFIQHGGKYKSRDEIEAYLEILQDKRNKFPDFRIKAVEEAIAGLTRMIQSLEAVKKDSTQPMDLNNKGIGESDKHFVARLGRRQVQLRGQSSTARILEETKVNLTHPTLDHKEEDKKQEIKKKLAVPVQMPLAEVSELPQDQDKIQKKF